MGHMCKRVGLGRGMPRRKVTRGNRLNSRIRGEKISGVRVLWVTNLLRARK